LAEFTGQGQQSFDVLPVTTAQFRAAPRMADQYELGLRAGDALLLAVCADFGAALCTLDGRLGAAGPALAVPAIRL
jgi:predicted nucleic acid-binding protein